MSAHSPNAAPPAPAPANRPPARSPERNAPPQEQPRFSPADALDAIGGGGYLQRYIDSKISSTATAQVRETEEATARRTFTRYSAAFGPVASEVFQAAHDVNTHLSSLSFNRPITDLAMIDAFMPGSQELVEMTHRAIENEPHPIISPAEQPFMRAMHNKAQAWKEKAKVQPVEVGPDSYRTNTEYKTAEIRAVDALIQKSQNAVANALRAGNPTLAAMHRQEQQELEAYRDMFVVNPAPAENHRATKDYMAALRADEAGSTRATSRRLARARTAMDNQSTIDHVFAASDRKVKMEMRRALDTADTREIDALKTQLADLEKSVSKGYKSKRTLLGKGGRVDRRTYDALVEEIVDLEARMEVRKHKDRRDEDAGPFDEDGFVNARTAAYFGNVSEGTSKEHLGGWKGKGLRGIGRAILNIAAGRKHDTGAKVTKGVEKWVKIGLRVATGLGVVAAGAATGGLSVVAWGVSAYAVHRHIGKDAEANADLVNAKAGGMADTEKALTAIRGAGTRREKIRAAARANREANNEYNKTVTKKALGRASITAIAVGGSTLFVLSPAEEWIAKGVMNVWDAGASIVEEFNEVAEGHRRNEIRELAYKYWN